MGVKITRSIAEIRSDLRGKIAALEERIAALRLEEETLAKAEVIAERYGTAQPDLLTISGSTTMVTQVKVGKPARSRSGSPRPKGVPSLPEMINFALREAVVAGKPGLTGKEILEHIDKTYWKGVSPNLVLPTAWRLAKVGRLVREGSLYKPVPQTNTGQRTQALAR